VLFAVVGLAGAAGAAELISIGEPVDDPKPRGEGVQPVAAGEIAVTAPDAEQPVPWALRIYDSGDQQCALAGQLRGNTLGIASEGRFRPYAKDTGGACGQLDRLPYFVAVRQFGGERPRTLLFGRAGTRVTRLDVRHGGRHDSTRPARGGAFLFVFEGTVPSRAFQLTALDASGEPVSG
jgi:hypothetical protein